MSTIIKLKKPHTEAREAILKRIELAKGVRVKNIRGQKSLERAEDDFRRWQEKNVTVLGALFHPGGIIRGYTEPRDYGHLGKELDERIQSLKMVLKNDVQFLQEILTNLEKFEFVAEEDPNETERSEKKKTFGTPFRTIGLGELWVGA